MSTPTTEIGFSYEYAVDVNLALPGQPDNWQNIRFISAVDPQVTSVTQDGATYDDNGAPHPIKTSESWTLGFTVQAHRLPDGTYLPELERILALAGPEAVGNAASGVFRWYDDPVGAEPNPDEAYQGTGTVAVTRQNTGNDQIGGWTVTVTGQGRRQRIANPSTASSGAVPTIASVQPSGAAAAELVTITGTGFGSVTGAAGVKFGSANAADYEVVSGTKIVASLPAGSAGSAPVTVTSPSGASTPAAYTRA